MKRFIIMTLFVTCFMLGSEAQNYTVFYLKGEVRCQQNGKTTVLKEKQQVASNATFILGKDMALILKDEENCRLPVIKGPCKGQLSKLVKKDKASILERSKEYFSHLIGKSRTDVKQESERMKEMGSISRQPVVGERPEENQEAMKREMERMKMMQEVMEVEHDVERIIEELDI
ncbi:MAG: hypothetical protein IKG99_09490 [Bacteroidaceae bacterium]|nr:hypothetical protein [Bacteroidaceae bacterium]